MDYPRDEIMRMAHNAIRDSGGPDRAWVHFKFTCEKCGARCTFEEKNSLFERGTCYQCGTDQPVTKAGFALHMLI
jgi:hypothetical protein